MDWSMVITIVGTNVAMMAFIAGFIIWAVNKLENDIKSLDQKINNVDGRLEGWMRYSIAVQAEQAKRTDKLYEMFIDLLK